MKTWIDASKNPLIQVEKTRYETIANETGNFENIEELIIAYLYVNDLKPGQGITDATWHMMIGLYYPDKILFSGADGSEIRLENGTWQWYKPSAKDVAQPRQVYIITYMLLPEIAVDELDWTVSL